MWEQALATLARAERLQRRFFALGRGGGGPSWEPPVDLFETEDAVWLVAALPGVQPEGVEVVAEQGTIAIRGERRIPLDLCTGTIRRLEIPYGRFERRIEFALALIPDRREMRDGCLYLRFRKNA